MTFTLTQPTSGNYVLTQTDSDEATISSIREDPNNLGSQTLITFTADHAYAVGDLITITNASGFDGHYDVVRMIDARNITIPYVDATAHTAGTVMKGDKGLANAIVDEPTLVSTDVNVNPGVFESNVIGQSGDQHHMFRIHGNIQIVVNGTMRINYREELWVNDDVLRITITVSTGGLLILGHQEMIHGAVYRPDWCPIKFTKTFANGITNADLRVAGSFTQYGGTIYGHGMIYFEPESHIRLITGTLYGTKSVNVSRILSESKDLHITDDYRAEGSYRFDFAYPAVRTTGFRPAYTDNGTFRVRSAADLDDTYVFENYDAKGIVFAGDAFQGSKLEFKNLAYEGELLVTHNNPGDTTPVTSVTKELIMKTVDIHGQPVEWARFYIHDTNNGNRPTNGTYLVNSQIESFDTDRIANNLTLRGGVAPVIKLLTRTLREGHSSGNVYGAINTQGTPWPGSSTTLIDYRSKNNSYDDLFDIYIWQYAHRLRILEDVPMRGAGVLTITAELVPDPYVTVSQDEANAYQGRFTLNGTTDVLHVTIDSDLDQLYDYLKVLKIDVNTQFDPAFEPVEYPSIDKQIGTADGTTLDIGAVNVVINNGITLSTGKKFTVLKTTGTVSGNFDTAIHTGTHISALISTDHSDTSIYYRAYNVNGSFTDGYVTHTDGSDFRIQVADGGRIEAVAKSPRHKFHRFTITYEDPNYHISLDPEPHVRSVDLSAYRHDPDGLNTDNMHIEYLASKTRLTYGVIDLSDKVEASKAILDDRMQTQEGMEFLYHFENSKLEDEYLLASTDNGIVYAFNHNEDILNPKSFNTTLREFVDWTSHDGLVYGLQGTHVRKVKVFLEDGTRLEDRDFDLEINFPRTISYFDGHLFISDNNARMVFAFVAPTREKKGGVRDNGKNYALDHAGGNVDPRGADHINGVHYILDGTNKQTFGYKDKVRHTDGELDVSALTTPRGLAYLFGRTYVLDTGDPLDDSTGEIRAFSGDDRDLENDVGATNDIKSIGAIRRFGKWPDSVVGGQPYLIEFDRIQINSKKLEYVRMSDMTADDLSKAGLYVVDENDNTYTAPVSYNGRVTFNANQNVTIIDDKTIENIISKLIASGEFGRLFDTTDEILKHLKNNMVWEDSTTLVLYDDDGSTELYRWTITDSGRTIT